MIDLTIFASAAQAVAEETVKAAAETVNAESGGGVIGLLGLNWKLFVAQLINFGIIVPILWKWVFTPVTTALQNRTKKIEESMADAEKIKKQVEELAKYKEEQEKLAREDYGKILNDAKSAAQLQRIQILDESKKQAEKLISDANKKITSERDEAIRAVKSEMTDLVVMVTEKIISEKMTGPKDLQMIKDALNKIK